jgi:hypothetical protein
MAGQVLSLPNQVINLKNTSSTFRVYDPNKAIGDVDPSVQIPTPQPAANSHKKHGCGIAQIFVAIVAVAVAVATAGAALAATGVVSSFSAGVGAVTGGLIGATGVSVGLPTLIAAGALGGAVGSIVSQGVGIAIGAQDKFSWASVGLAAIAGGVGAGLQGAIPGSGFVAGAERGIAGSVISQGIGLATGLQSKFDWTGVAVAGIGGGVGAKFGGWAATPQSLGGLGLSGLGANLVGGVAGSIAGAATRSLITGTDFGDNILADLPTTIGNTLGNAIAGAIGGGDFGSLAKDIAHDVGVLGEGIRAAGSAIVGGVGNFAGRIGDALSGAAPATASSASSSWGGPATLGGDVQDTSGGGVGLINASFSAPSSGATVSELVVTAPFSQRQIDTYNYYFNYAANKHRGPNVPGTILYVPPISGTHFAGNRENDAANRAYATAKALGLPSINGVNIDDFIDEGRYGPRTAAAMNAVFNRYYAIIGYSPITSGDQIFDDSSYVVASDPFHNVPTKPIDYFALQHDLQEVAAGNNNAFRQAMGQYAADRNLEAGAFASARYDLRYHPSNVATDIAIAKFADLAATVQQVPAFNNPQTHH